MFAKLVKNFCMEIILIYFYVLILVGFVFKIKKQNIKKLSQTYYFFSEKDRKIITSLAAEIKNSLTNLLPMLCYKNFNKLKDLGFVEAPVFKMNICSKKEFCFYVFAKRQIKSTFNMVLLHKNIKIDDVTKIANHVFVFNEEKLSLNLLGIINAFNVKDGKFLKIGASQKLIECESNFEKYENSIYKLFSKNGLLSKTRNYQTICLHASGNMRIKLNFCAIFGEKLFFVKKKSKNVYEVLSLYSQEKWYLSTKEKIENGCKNVVELNLKNSYLVISKNQTCEKQNLAKKCYQDIIKINLKLSNKLKVICENKTINKLFNEFLPNLILKNLVVNDEFIDYNNFKNGHDFFEFEIDNAKKMFLLTRDVSYYYNYLKRCVFGINEQSTYLNIKPHNCYFKNFKLYYCGKKIDVKASSIDCLKIDGTTCFGSSSISYKQLHISNLVEINTNVVD